MEPHIAPGLFRPSCCTCSIEREGERVVHADRGEEDACATVVSGEGPEGGLEQRKAEAGDGRGKAGHAWMKNESQGRATEGIGELPVQLIC